MVIFSSQHVGFASRVDVFRTDGLLKLPTNIISINIVLEYLQFPNCVT